MGNGLSPLVSEKEFLKPMMKTVLIKSHTSTLCATLTAIPPECHGAGLSDGQGDEGLVLWGLVSVVLSMVHLGPWGLSGDLQFAGKTNTK